MKNTYLFILFVIAASSIVSCEKSKDYINVNRIFNEMDFKTEMVKLFEETDNHKTHGVIQLNITVLNFAKVNV